MLICGFIFVGWVFSSLVAVSSLVFWFPGLRLGSLYPSLGAELLMTWMASGSAGGCLPSLGLEFWLCVWPLIWLGGSLGFRILAWWGRRLLPEVWAGIW